MFTCDSETEVTNIQVLAAILSGMLNRAEVQQGTL